MAFFPDNNDVFRTQADPRFNSFAEPMNPVNQNPGSWGIDSNYLTPAYLAPYRPQYQGSSGNQYRSYNPKWGYSFNNLMNPFGPQSNYGGNAMAQRNPMYDSMAYRPMDAMASFAQNWAAPTAASIWAYHKLASPAAKIGGAAGEGLMSGILGAGGFNVSKAAMGVSAGRALGAAAGTMFLPMAAAQAATSAFDSAVMDPYNAQRQSFRNLRENFGGVTFGEEGVGNPLSGGGLNRETSARLAKGLSISATKDMTFSQQETSLMADYASRSGLMDNVNPSQMSKRFEQVMKQMKVVMSVANTADFKETIEIMAKMQMAGVNAGNLSTTMGQLAGHAAGGGFSVQKAMNTVGMQGQYLFGAAGLTPYLGQTTAFGANAALSAAFRNGMISPALMARMGGMEGATQSALAGQLAAYQTPYSQFSAYNAYFGGGEKGSVVKNMSAFGGQVSKDPLGTLGRIRMGGDALASRHLQDRGLSGVQEQVYQIAKTVPNAIRNGKVDEGIAFMIMTDNMGIPEAQARALLQQIGTYSNKEAVSQLMAGNTRGSIDSMLMYKQQEGLDKGIFTSPYNAVKRGALSAQRVGAEVVGRGQEAYGRTVDSFQNWWDRAIYRVKDREEKALYLDDITNQSKSTIKAIDTESASARKFFAKNPDLAVSNNLRLINDLALKGNKDASSFISGDSDARKSALDKLIASGDVNQMAEDSKAGVLGAAGTLQTTDRPVKELNLLDLDSEKGRNSIYEDKGGFFGKSRKFDRVQHLEELRKINELAQKGDTNAIKFIQAKDNMGRQTALYDLAKANKIDERYLGSSAAQGISDMAGNIGNRSEKTTIDGKTVDNTLGRAMDNILKGGTPDQVLQYMDLMKEVRDKGADKIDQTSKDKISALLRDKTDLTPQKLAQMAQDEGVNAASGGIMHLQGLSAKHFGTMDELSKYLQKEGMALQGPSVEVGADKEAAIQQGELQASLQKQRSTIKELSEKQRIDTSVTQGTINALDMGVAIGSFAESVQKFGEHVDSASKDKKRGVMTDQNDALVKMKGARVFK